MSEFAPIASRRALPSAAHRSGRRQDSLQITRAKVVRPAPEGAGGSRDPGSGARAAIAVHTQTQTHTHSHTLTFLALRRRGRHQNAAPKEREAGAGCSSLHDALQARSLVPTLATGRSRASSLAAGLPHARTPARWPQDPLRPGPAAREQLLSLQPESLMEVG